MSSIKVFEWAIYTIVIPVSPLLVVAIIASQLESAIPYERILSGTEVFLLCLFITATTYRYWDGAKAWLARSRLGELLSASLLIWLFSCATMSAFILIHVHVQDLGLPTPFVSNAAIAFGILTTALCLTAQVVLAKDEKAKRHDAAEILS